MFGLFTKRQKRQEAILPLWKDIVDTARHPRFFIDYGVEDTFEGRFELLTLIMVLALRRLRQLPSPAGDVAQELIDAFFAALDDGLRRAGIGDVSVPKRMKKLAQGFYGRAEAYGAALDLRDEEALRVVLARNLYSSTLKTAEIHAELLTCFSALLEALQACDLALLLQGNILTQTMDREETV